jgi:hypothetical protein
MPEQLRGLYGDRLYHIRYAEGGIVDDKGHIKPATLGGMPFAIRDGNGRRGAEVRPAIRPARRAVVRNGDGAQPATTMPGTVT